MGQEGHKGISGTILEMVLDAVREAAGDHILGKVKERAGIDTLDPHAVYPPGVFLRLREALEEYFGRGAAPILVRVGYLVGRLIEHAYGLREAGDWRDAVAESLRALAPGLPVAEIWAEKSGSSLIVHMRGSVESYTGGAPRREPSCHISRGFLSYLGERLSGYRVAVDELECQACGADHCVFKVYLLAPRTRIRPLARRAGVARPLPGRRGPRG